ncbi:aminotransferase class I/II-fold pyridoxal phosphate-dependent enzyme [Altibacter sp.]|uniref:pyridoxal phosphate-dependent decarboxylase family protein n=1 Tax=Altibacter sp. TaxID=2024823 RepID=UPI000C8E0D0A|nr:aminotransferase class I/II-fold pyridoxal phosphate-dependent enzyme [Altibacter sp.]MAP55824.1 L-2,4-diaminobutyrate decarboxylase [Altibacter sp.]
MESLIQRIKVLQETSASLEPSEQQRNTYTNQLSTFANRFINRLPTTPAYSSEKETEGALAISSEPRSFEALLTLYEQEVASKGINAASGGHLGYIPGGGIFTAALADYMADVTNEYSGMYYASPGAVSMENELIDWMKSIFGFPKEAVGNLTSGGSIANLIALTAARDHHRVCLERIPTSVIYVSEQVHHCIQKALRIIGLDSVIIRYVPLSTQHRMETEALSEMIRTDLETKLHPFLIIASAGTTDTGAIDPLEAIGKIAREHDLWYHIDGAYGGFFILTDSKKAMLKGIEMADSLVIDPHKSLFLPYGLGAVLVKNKEAVFHSHHYTANYMQDAIQEHTPVNPADVSPELTKHFRGLRLWLPLQLHGIAPFVACLEEKLLLTQYFREQLVKRGFAVGPEPDLSVSYFWFPKEADQENQFNQALLKELHANGHVFLSSTRIGEKFVIRMALLSFRTKLATVDCALEMIDNVLKKVS